MSETATISLRAPRKEEAAAVATFSRALSAEVGIDATTDADDVLHEWSEPGFDRELHARVVSDGDEIIGFADVFTQPPRAWTTGGVLPGARGRGIGSALLDWVIGTASATPGIDTLFISVNTKLPDATALVEARGFEHVRTFFRMVHRTPGSVVAPALPDGIRLGASLSTDELIDAIIAGHDGSFIDHWNFTPWLREDAVHMLTHPDVDPGLLLIAFGPDGTVAGINLCFLEKGDGFLHGTVGVLGTTRPFRGIGLGSALLRHGVRALADRGATLVDLGVDSDSMTGALGLYERAGFERNQERWSYSLTVS